MCNGASTCSEAVGGDEARAAHVVLVFSMSLDGYVAGPDVSADRAMGRNGDLLHRWMFEDAPDRAADRAVVAEIGARVGAVLLGRRTFDVGLQYWNDTPYPAPSFVVTHEARDPMPMASAAFTFVDTGIEEGVRLAKAAAGDRDVVVMGADVARQLLRADLADELFITIVPLLLGGGERLFDAIDDGPRKLAIQRIVPSPVAAHIAFGLKMSETQTERRTDAAPPHDGGSSSSDATGQENS